MAKKKTPASVLEAADLKHLQNTEQYVKQVQKLYSKAIDDISKLVAANSDILGDDDFTFDKKPALEKKVNDIVKGLSGNITAVIDRGDRSEWLGACAKSDQFIASVLNTSKMPESKLKTYQDRNLEALHAFQERKINGLNLSDRVWHYVSPMMTEAELAIATNAGINTEQNLQKLEDGIGTGKSAAELSRDIRSCLKEPNKLFRRVRDKYGNLHLSKAAKLYHPGQGVYRSSYKNAMRLTRSEINMAYRQSDHMRWNQLDFVVGQEIALSNNHTIVGKDGKTRVTLVDICDELVGRYPKEFKFVGWHPQCKCHATPVLKSLDELDEEIDANGNYKQMPSANEVTEAPANFNAYIKDNEQRIAGWSSTPYYIKDNPQYIDKALHPENYIKKSLVLTEEQTIRMSELEMYGYNHAGSKKFNAALEDAKKAILAGDQKAYEDALATMEFTKATNERIQALNAKKKAEKPVELTREEKIKAAAEKRHAARTPEKEKKLKEFAAKHKMQTEDVYAEIKALAKDTADIAFVDTNTVEGMMSGNIGVETEPGKKLPTTLEKMKKELKAAQAKKAEYDKLAATAEPLVKELDGISDLDTQFLKTATTKEEIQEATKKLQAAKEKLEKLTTIDDPLQVAKDYSVADAVATHNSVVKKIKEWKDKYSKDAFLKSTYTEDEYLAKKLDWEAYTYLEGNMNDVHSKFKTWKVAQKAYLKKLEEVRELIWKKNSYGVLNTLNQEMIAMNAPKSGAIMKAWKKAQNAVASGDHTAYEEAIEEYNQQKTKLLAKAAKKKPKPVSKEDVVFKKENFTNARKKKAKQFHTDESSQDYFFDNACEHYSFADNDTRIAAENYTFESGYLTKSARGITGYYEKQKSFAEQAAKDMQKLTDFIRQSSFEHDVWISREERVAFLTLKTSGLDANKLMDNVEEYKKKARIKYKGKRTAKEIDKLVEMYKKHEEMQLVGRTGVDPSIVSTSANMDQRFSGTGGDNRYKKPKVHLEIFCPKGTQAVYADPYNHYTANYVEHGPDGFWDAKSKPTSTSENEIILQQHTEFRITEARYNEAEDKWYVKAEVIAQRPRDIKGIVYDSNENGYRIEFE